MKMFLSVFLSMIGPLFLRIQLFHVCDLTTGRAESMQVFTQQPVEKQDGMRHALTQDGRRLLKAAKNCYVT